MLSFGIEYERAFSIAFWSARFAAGSGPPSRAATMIARASFEKSLPRLVSAAPFLCLIELHLLCPDMQTSPRRAGTFRFPRSPLHLSPPRTSATRLLPDELQEALVDPGVVRQLLVERSDAEPTLAHQ